MIKSISLLSIFFFIFSLVTSAPAYADVLSDSVGFWELDPDENEDRSDFTCDENPMEISVDREKNLYTSKRNDYTDTANIIEVYDNAYLLQYVNEERLDPNGAPVKWYFVMPNKTTFYWVRADWADQEDYNGERTFKRNKCDPAQRMS